MNFVISYRLFCYVKCYIIGHVRDRRKRWWRLFSMFQMLDNPLFAKSLPFNHFWVTYALIAYTTWPL